MVVEPPILNFRLPTGWTFDSELDLPEFRSDAAAVGVTGASPAPVLLGKLAEFQSMRKSVWLDMNGAHAIYVMGKRRSGKSYTLGVLVEGLTTDGWIAQGQQPPQAAIVFDTMNVFLTAGTLAASVAGESSKLAADLRRWQLPESRPRIRFYHPAGTAGPVEVGSQDFGLRATDVLLEDWYRFFELDPYADPIAHLLSDTYQRVAVDGYDNDSGQTVPANPNYRLPDLVECIRTCPAFASYDDRTREATARRLEAMQRLGIFADTPATIANVLRRGEAAVLFLRDIDQSVRSLFVSVLVRRLMERRSGAERFERLGALAAAKAEAETDEARKKALAEEARQYAAQAAEGTPRTWVVIDEAHNYIPARGEPPSRRPLKKLIDEGRNLGLSIVVATQQPSGLDQSIQRNADLLLVHSMSVRDDIDAAFSMLNTRVPDSAAIGSHRVESRVFERVVRSLPRGYCLVSSDEAERIFPMLVRPRISYHGALDY